LRHRTRAKADPWRHRGTPSWRGPQRPVCYHVSLGSSREFMWRKAQAAILAVEKEIRRLPCGRIVNMPRLREVTAQQELEAIVRGERAVVPPEMEAAVEAPADVNIDRHPYLRRMQYRGGGFAILMAFHRRLQRPGSRQFMFKSEIIREAQPFCDVSMLDTGGWARANSCGWLSHRSLIAHRLLVAGRGPTPGSGREEFRLTDDGRRFLNAMLHKWPDEEALARADLPDVAPAVFAGGDAARLQEARPEALVRADLPDVEPGVFPEGDAARPQGARLPEARPQEIRPMLVYGTGRDAVSDGLAISAWSSGKTPPRRWASGVVMPVRHGPAAAQAISARASPDRGTPSKRSDRANCEAALQNKGKLAAVAGFQSICAAATPQRKRRTQEIPGESAAPMKRPVLDHPEVVFEISSEEEIEGEAVEPAASAHAGCEPLVVRLLVDDRERLRDSEPRGLLDRSQNAIDALRVDGVRAVVQRRRLRFGDFAWVIGGASSDVDACSVLPCVVERKRISDLVGRSATGAHVRQLQRLETCGLPHCFLLLEGDLRHAAHCAVYDEDRSTLGEECSEDPLSDVIRSREDIEDLCARLLVTGSRVGVITTQDSEGTARAIGHLSAWFESCPRAIHEFAGSAVGRESLVLVRGPHNPMDLLPITLRGFEEVAAARAASRDDLGLALGAAGVPATVTGALCRRFGGIETARAALLACELPEQRACAFDFLPACEDAGDRICAAASPVCPCLRQPWPLSPPRRRRWNASGRGIGGDPRRLGRC